MDNLLQIAITTKRKEWLGSTSAFNALVKLAMNDGGEFWIDNILDKHFGLQAPARYHYPRPTERTTARKLAAGPIIWDSTTRKEYSNPHPGVAEQLVWTGRLKEFILSNKARWKQAVKTVGVTAKEEMRVRIGYGHPLNTKYGASNPAGGFLQRWAQGDGAQVSLVVKKSLIRRMNAARVMTETVMI